MAGGVPSGSAKLMTGPEVLPQAATGRQRGNMRGIEKPMPGPVPDDQRSSRLAMTGVRRIATSGRMLATLLEIVARGQRTLNLAEKIAAKRSSP